MVSSLFIIKYNFQSLLTLSQIHLEKNFSPHKTVRIFSALFRTRRDVKTNRR